MPGVLGAERVHRELDGEYVFRVGAGTVERELLLMLAPNMHAQVDPEPEDVCAIDGYPAQLGVRLVGRKDEAVQHVEGRLVFDRLVAGRPDVPMLLLENLATLTVAYLPGVGTQVFEEPIGPDAPGLELWGPWVRGAFE